MKAVSVMGRGAASAVQYGFWIPRFVLICLCWWEGQ